MAFVSEQCDTELDDSPANVPVWAVYMTAFRFLGALTQEPRTIIYIDGFNLYYGALKGTPYKWLDLARFFRLIRPHDDIRCKHRHLHAGRRLSSPVLLSITFFARRDELWGRFLTCGGLSIRLPHLYAPATALENRQHRLRLAAMCDNLVLVSGDSDLVPAIRMIRHRYPTKETTVYVPARDPGRGAAVELRMAANKNRDLPLNVLPHAQFSNPLPDGYGGFLRRSASW
jgi:hypothetical protein